MVKISIYLPKLSQNKNGYPLSLEHPDCCCTNCDNYVFLKCCCQFVNGDALICFLGKFAWIRNILDGKDRVNSDIV